MSIFVTIKQMNVYQITDVNVIGSNLRTLRLEKKLTQEQLVAKINLLGWSISRSSLAKIESKNRKVTDIEVIYLATALNIEIVKLFE